MTIEIVDFPMVIFHSNVSHYQKVLVLREAPGTRWGYLTLKPSSVSMQRIGMYRVWLLKKQIIQNFDQIKANQIVALETKCG